MASSTCTASAMVAKGLPVFQLNTSRMSKCNRVGQVAFSRNLSFTQKTLSARGASRVRCEALSAPLIISLSTGALLFLGRFVFLPFQRNQVAKAGLPVQNGITHFEAGDSRAAEVSSLLKTNDPAGFTIVDVLGWGALGHAIAFFILASASNGYDPRF